MLKRRKKNALWPRNALQIFFFALIAAISINHTLVEQGNGIPLLAAASVHAVCPFGGVETLYTFITTGTFVQKIHSSSFILMISVFLLSLLFGGVFCGWVCPFGSIQEWVGRFGRRIFKRRYNRFIPYRFDRYLRYLRYLVLVWVLYMTAVTGKLIFSDVDPYYALFNFWTGEVAIAAYVILAITLLGSLFVERPWCKYACPYGAVLGLTNLVRVFQIRRSESLCKFDGACSKTCPMNIPVDEMKVIRNHQCIACLKCTSAEGICPVPGTVELAALGGK